LDLLSQFKKIVLLAPYVHIREIVVVPFSFSGPGLFSPKNITWPDHIYCINQDLPLFNVAAGATVRGHLAIQKHNVMISILKTGKPFVSNRVWIPPSTSISSQLFKESPWLSTGFPNRPVERVGFKVESRGPFDKRLEFLIFEILTNGSISPRQALRESAISLVQKFLAITNVTVAPPISKFDHKKVGYWSAGSKSFLVLNQKTLKKTFFDPFE
jgi:DNA-directed RNA polymerase alpha subunit